MSADISPPTVAAAPVVAVEDRAAVRVITLNRPEARNAVDLAVALAIEQAVEDYERDPGLRCAVVRATGSVFCAGMDLKAFLRGERPSTEAGGFAGLVERARIKPLVACVDGPAVAGGFEIVLACDLVVASTRASFGLPEVRRGLVAAGGGLLRLPGRVPFHVAMELALTGDRMSSAVAHRYGLVNRLADPDDVDNVALDLARAVAANGPLAVAATRQILTEGPAWPREEAFDRQRLLSEPVRASEDAREGALAFTQRRDPVWTGR